MSIPRPVPGNPVATYASIDALCAAVDRLQASLDASQSTDDALSQAVAALRSVAASLQSQIDDRATGSGVRALGDYLQKQISSEALTRYQDDQSLTVAIATVSARADALLASLDHERTERAQAVSGLGVSTGAARTRRIRPAMP